MGKKTILGLDIGGTKTALTLYEEGTWKELAHAKFATRAERGLPGFLETVFAEAKKVMRIDTQAAGIGLAGLVRSDGVTHRTPNIPGGDGVAVQRLAEKALKIPVSIENDARCFTLAEATIGAGKGHNVVIGMTLGTGVGGGIVIDGKLFHGAHGFAGEIGHMLLCPGEPPFPTKDKRGEVEQFFSGTALGKRCAAAKRPEDYLDGEVCGFLRPEVFREIAWAVTSLTPVLDASIIVFGGSTGRALQPHLSKITQELKKWMLPGMPIPELAVAARADSGTLGAALLTTL